MNRFRLLTLTSLCVLASCNPPDTALRVSVALRSQGTNKVRADCLKLSVLDGTTGAELKSLVIKRPDDDTALFGVRRGGDLPAAVKFQASGLIGTCTDEATLKVNALSELVSATFPESGVSSIDLTVDLPNSTLDFDRDGFISAAKGGPDCKDDDNTIYPDAVQVCANTADTDCNGLGGCDDGACNTALVCVNPPDRVVVTANFASMKRYECSGKIHVELQNAGGLRIAVRDTQLTFASSLAGMTVHATENCNDTPLTGVRIPYGMAGTDVYLAADDRAFGTEVLTVTANQVATPGSLTVDVRPQPVDHVEFTSMPLTTTRSLKAGACGTQPVTIEFKDAMNRHTDVASDTTVQLTSTPGDLNNANIFFSDAACSVGGPTPMLRPGQGTITTWLLAKRAGQFTLRAAPSTGTAATQVLTVSPNTPTQLAFTNQALALLANDTCSQTTLRAELQDQFGNASTLTGDLAVRTSVTGLTGVTFSTSPGCMPAETDFTIPGGSSLLTLYVAALGLPSGMGTVQLAATNNAAITGIASQALNVAAGPATRFTWNGSAQTPIAGQCSSNPITLTLTDTTGSVSPAMSNITFTLAAVPASADASFRFFSNAGCMTDLNNQVTFATGQSSATVYFRGNKAVSSFELVGTGTSLVGPANRAQGNAIRAAAPAKLVFIAPLAQTAQAGVCTASPYQANVLDQYDNPTSFPTAQTVSVTSSPPGVTVGQGTCDVATSVPLLANATTASFSARHTVTSASATPYTLTASVAGFSTAPGASLTVTPGPSNLKVDAPVATPTLMAGACQNITISRRDTFMNAAPVSGNQTLALNFPPGTTWVVYPTPGCSVTPGPAVMANNTNTVSFSVSPQTAGVHMFNASIGAGATLQQVPLSITVTPANASLRFENPATGGTTASASQIAGGCTPITLGRRDMYGNDVTLPSAQSMTFNVPAGTTVHSGTPCTTGATGNAITSIPLTTADVRATFYVRATLSSPTGGTAMQTITASLDSMTATLTLAVAPGPSMLSFVTPSGGAASVVADTCQTVTLERRDGFGNLVPAGASPSVAFTPISGASFIAYDNVNCMGTGTVVSVPVAPLATSKTFSIKSLKAGTQAVDLLFETQTARLTLTVSPGPFSKLIVENVPTTFTAGGCSGLITVRRQDANNNDITADGPLSVALSSSRFSFSNTPTTCAGAATGATVTIPMGSAVSADAIYATATQSGATTVVATSSAPLVTGSAPSTIGASTATQLVFVTAPGTVVANACSPNIQIEQRDTYGNQVTPSSQYTVTLGSSGSVFSSAASCAGTLPVNLQSGNVVGNFTFKRTSPGASETITVSGTGPVLSAMQTWTVTPGVASRLAWKQNPVAAPARFACASAGILQTQDTVGNASNVTSALTVTPSSTNQGLTFFSDATCTTPLTTLSIASGNSETPEFYFFATGSGVASLAANAPLFTAAPTRSVTPTNNQGSLVVTPANPAVEAGACVALTIERRTNANTPFTTGTSVLSAAAAASVSLYSSSDCSTTPLPTSFTITQGSSTAVVYARGLSAPAAGANPADNIFSANDQLGGSTTGITTLKVYPLVRRGACDLSSANSARCAVSPPIPGDVITRSFLVFTSKGRPANGATLAPADQNVECHLETSAGPGVEVVCTRVGNTGTMNVNYQVVSFGRDASNGGVTVQHFPKIASTGTTTTQTIGSVNTGNTFLLASSTLSGALNDGDGFPLVRFATTGAAVTSVEILGNTSTPTTRDVSVQVVTMAGAAVDHRSVTNPTQSTGGFTVPTNTTPTSFALAMAQVPANTTDPAYMCKRRFNTRVGGSNVTLHRGNASPSSNCTTDPVTLIAVQRVQVPGAASSVQFANDLAITGTNASVTSGAFTAVALHKSITFLMNQGPGGQTAGESNATGTQNDNDDTGTFHATVDFASTTTVTVTRDAPGSSVSSTFSPVIVQFDP